VRSLTVAVVVLSLAALTGLALSSVALAQPAGPQTMCREQARYPLWASASHVVVPVTVHRMKYKNNKFAYDDTKLEQDFSLAWLEKLFARRGPVNGIWEQAKIALVLYRVEVCEYALEDFAFQPRRENEVPSPDAGEAGARLFRGISETYNDRVLGGLDLYLWWQVRQWAAYGLPHKPDRPGAVWLDRDCLSPTFTKGCDRLLAHETGHFFNLCHSCKTVAEGAEPVRCRVCVPDRQEPPLCGVGEREGRLMRGTYDGVRLTECERGEAAARARGRALPMSNN
jgi:hypothetical protein